MDGNAWKIHGNETDVFRMENFRVFLLSSSFQAGILKYRRHAPLRPQFPLSWICNVDWTELIPESLGRRIASGF